MPARSSSYGHRYQFRSFTCAISTFDTILHYTSWRLKIECSKVAWKDYLNGSTMSKRKEDGYIQVCEIFGSSLAEAS